jgi:hypothetical protein
MQFGKKSIYSENCMKLIQVFRGKSAEFLMLKQITSIATAELQRDNQQNDIRITVPVLRYGCRNSKPTYNILFH